MRQKSDKRFSAEDIERLMLVQEIVDTYNKEQLDKESEKNG